MYFMLGKQFRNTYLMNEKSSLSAVQPGNVIVKNEKYFNVASWIDLCYSSRHVSDTSTHFYFSIQYA